MSGFIIRSLQVIVYIVFFLCILGGLIVGAVGGYESSYGDPVYAVIGGLVGLLLGFIMGVVYAGVIILLVDIRNTLREINAKG